MEADELARDSQQVIQGQQQGTPQVDDHDLLRRREHGLQMMGSVRAVPKDGALLPLVHRLFGDAKALGQDTGCLIAGRDLGTHGGRGAGILVQGHQNGFTPRVDGKDSIRSCRTVLTMNSG